MLKTLSAYLFATICAGTAEKERNFASSEGCEVQRQGPLATSDESCIDLVPSQHTFDFELVDFSEFPRALAWKKRVPLG